MMWGRVTNKVTPLNDSAVDELNTSLGSISSLNASTEVVSTSLSFSEKESDVAASTVGITSAHHAYFSKLAREHHLMILWRPVNGKAAGKLDNNYMGKRLNLKSKSSEFGPIAGDIPSNPRLGKAIFLVDEKIQYLDAVNRSLIEASADRSDTMVRDEVNVLDSIQKKQDKIAALNDNYSVTEIDKYIDGAIVFYAKNHDETILTLEPNAGTPLSKTPRFFRRVSDNGYQEYQYDLNQFSGRVFHKPSEVIPANQESEAFLEAISVHPVKILAYKRYQYDPVQGCIISDKPITADYDELACCPRNDYPFYHGNPVSTQITQSMYQAFAGKKGFTEEEKIELVAQLIIQHDDAKYAEEQALVDRLSMGYMTDHEHALKVVEIIDTEGATNHGPEVYNFYYTEPFSSKAEDVYFAHLPDGKTELFRNDQGSTAEQKICYFMNRWRVQGYPVPVNPCWGWEIDQNGLLTTEGSADRKQAWNKVMVDLKHLEGRVDQLGKRLKVELQTYALLPSPETRVLVSELHSKIYPDSTPEKIEVVLGLYPEDKKALFKFLVESGALQRLAALINQHEDEKRFLAYQRTLVQLQLQIERIRLGSNLIYSECSLIGDSSHAYSEDEKDLNRQVSQYIQKHVTNIKDTRVHLLKKLQLRPLSELLKADVSSLLGNIINLEVRLEATRLAAAPDINSQVMSPVGNLSSSLVKFNY